MPDKLRSLGGDDVVRILGTFGFQVIGQRGSHAKLRRIMTDGSKQTLHIPMHRELRRGTLRAVFQQACLYIPEPDLRLHFFTE